MLVSTLFIIVLPAMLEKTFQDKKDGVYIQSRQDVDLFNVSHFLARTTSTFVLISELLFEDYSALLVLSLRESQQTINGTASQPDVRRLDVIRESCVLYDSILGHHMEGQEDKQENIG